MNASAVQASFISKPGGRPGNEDACGYWRDELQQRSCYVLADGAGGHAGGELAARLAVQATLEACAQAGAATEDGVRTLLDRAQAAVVRERAASPQFDDMRTTLVVLFIDESAGRACWGHVGDSRLYRFVGRRLRARTRDHSLDEALRLAGMNPCDGELPAARQNILVAALGNPGSFAPTVGAACDLEQDCAFLLCSDGFWGDVAESVMESALAHADAPDTWLADMEAALLESPKADRDNYTAMALWFRSAPAAARATAKSATPFASGHNHGCGPDGLGASTRPVHELTRRQS